MALFEFLNFMVIVIHYMARLNLGRKSNACSQQGGTILNIIGHGYSTGGRSHVRVFGPVGRPGAVILPTVCSSSGALRIIGHFLRHRGDADRAVAKIHQLCRIIVALRIIDSACSRKTHPGDIESLGIIEAFRGLIKCLIGTATRKVEIEGELKRDILANSLKLR